MNPKRPPERTLDAPSAAGVTAPSTLVDDELPPPYFDERLVEPETREEMLDGHLIYAAPAKPPHADRHTRLDGIVDTHAPSTYTTSTDMLTRTDSGSDFATDTSIRRSGIDPRTGSRYLEEVVFEVVHTQSLSHMVRRARKLSARGVRRIFAIFVKTDEVAEWSATEDRFITLDIDDAIEDRTLIRPLPVRALLDREAGDEAVGRALKAKGNPVILEVRAEGRAEGLEEGLTKGRVEAIELLCSLLEIPLGPDERDHLATLDPDGLLQLRTELEAQRRWPRT